MVVETSNTVYYQGDSLNTDDLVVKLRYFDGVKVIDFGPVGYLWIGAAFISLILPLFNWKRKKQEI